MDVSDKKPQPWRISVNLADSIKVFIVVGAVLRLSLSAERTAPCIKYLSLKVPFMANMQPAARIQGLL